MQKTIIRFHKPGISLPDQTISISNASILTCFSPLSTRPKNRASNPFLNYIKHTMTNKICIEIFRTIKELSRACSRECPKVSA